MNKKPIGPAAAEEEEEVPVAAAVCPPEEWGPVRRILRPWAPSLQDQ